MGNDKGNGSELPRALTEDLDITDPEPTVTAQAATGTDTDPEPTVTAQAATGTDTDPEPTVTAQAATGTDTDPEPTVTAQAATGTDPETVSTVKHSDRSMLRSGVVTALAVLGAISIPVLAMWWLDDGDTDDSAADVAVEEVLPVADEAETPVADVAVEEVLPVADGAETPVDDEDFLTAGDPPVAEETGSPDPSCRPLDRDAIPYEYDESTGEFVLDPNLWCHYNPSLAEAIRASTFTHAVTAAGLSEDAINDCVNGLPAEREFSPLTASCTALFMGRDTPGVTRRDVHLLLMVE